MNDNSRIVYSSFLNLGEANSIANVTLNNNATITAPSVDFGWGANTNSTGVLNGTSSITLTGGINLARSGANAQGSLTLNDESKVTAGGTFLMAYAGTDAARALATLTVTEDAEFAAAGTADFGRSYGNASVNIAGTVKTGRANFGNTNANAVVTMTGAGSLAATGAIAIGNLSNCSVTVTMTGDTSMESASWIAVSNAYQGGGNAEVWMSDNATMTCGDELQVGWGGTGILHIGDGTATDNVVVSTAKALNLGWGTSYEDTEAIVNLNAGGTLEAPYIYTGHGVDDPGASAAILNFNGGLLRALGSDIPEVPEVPATETEPAIPAIPAIPFLSNNGGAVDFQLNVLAGGANIDSNGFSITITEGLTEDGVSTGGGLTKLGDGTLTLGGANTYTGATLVEAGALSVTGSIASDVTVADGAALLGTGTILGDVIAEAGSSVGPGASIGTLTVNGDAAVSGTLDIEYDSDTDTIDLLNVSGLLDLRDATLSFSDLGSGTLANGTYVFANYGCLLGTPTEPDPLPSGWSIDYMYNDCSSIALVVVPEPSVLALLAGLVALLAGCRTRR